MAGDLEVRTFAAQLRHRQACLVVGLLPEDHAEAVAVLRLAMTILHAAKNAGDDVADAMQEERQKALQ